MDVEHSTIIQFCFATKPSSTLPNLSHYQQSTRHDSVMMTPPSDRDRDRPVMLLLILADAIALKLFDSSSSSSLSA